ncbi:MAG: molybdate ABC transporter substrate-binding protein [Candidatus Solibacter usitatus]|nr:molybdate ABC transporter substrate-binding protein [Candidatus Solibacter usitatus]
MRLALLLPLLAQLASPQSLTIAAAADLSPLENPLRTAFQSTSPATIRFTFGSSGMLAHQIRNGAPYDIYLSANEQLVTDLATAGLLLPDSVHPYATGRLALWSSSGRIHSLSDLLQPSVRHIAIPNPDHAPYGVAARQTLQNQKLWTRLQPRIVLAENVRQAFEYARTGNADAVLTSWTLLHDRGGILISDSLHAPIRQSAGIVKGTPHEVAARAFLNFLLSPAGRSVLTRYGLFPPAP